MIKKHSDDPDVAEAARLAGEIIDDTLAALPAADSFDYGGHVLQLGEYNVCGRCTRPIAEAQAAEHALRAQADQLEDGTIREHISLAAELFHLEAATAIVRAEFHNGHNTERILNHLLGFQYDRGINDDYQHSHHGGA